MTMPQMKVVVLILILGMPLLARAAIDPAVQQRLAALAVPFVPNAGQWGERAAFAAQTFAGKLYVTQQGTSASPLCAILHIEYAFLQLRARSLYEYSFDDFQ